MKKLITILSFAIYTIGQAQTKANEDALVVPELEVDTNGVLKIIPSKTSSKSDFDFFMYPTGSRT